MTTEQTFLITYGLHNFVSHSPGHGQNAFVILRREGLDMVRHATSLIQGSYGDRADIRLV
ncbi:MAG: hypothetical protein COW30_13250 [Rhodospirillales bacterium CG15_BIG_FIL_POST_REV_8_21_14_020_66_15]|nr:MAG: hypothetical protein COW30_13250 [Rhodospirillales bacterium CG15_BIG_FIL_POST_REV_8_21_14_020_66_15]